MATDVHQALENRLPHAGAVGQLHGRRAGDLLESNRKPLGELVRLLEKEETLHREQIEGCLGRVPGKENIREIGVAKESG